MRWPWRHVCAPTRGSPEPMKGWRGCCTTLTTNAGRTPDTRRMRNIRRKARGYWGAGLSARGGPGHSRARGLYGSAAKTGVGPYAVCLRRTGGIPDGVRAGEAIEEPSRGGRGIGEAEIERQGICARSEPRRCAARGGRAGNAAGRSHTKLPGGHARDCRRTGPGLRRRGGQRR